MHLILSCLLAMLPPDVPSEPHLVAKVPDGCEVVERSLRFSRDGVACVYVVNQGTKPHPVINSILGAEFDLVDWPTIDAIGIHTAFRVREIDDRKKIDRFSVLYDGKIIASDDWVGPIGLDPVKSIPAYWIAEGRIQGASGRWEAGPATLVWGKYKSSKWQFVDNVSAPQFARDGKLLLTLCARGQGEFNVLTVDEKGKEEKRGGGDIFDAILSPTGRDFAYICANLVGEQNWPNRPQKLWVLTSDMKRNSTAGTRAFANHDSTGSPVYSADGQHLACKVTRASKMGVAIDDQKDAACDFDFVDELALKPDGSAVAFAACTGCTLDFKNGREVLRGVKATGGKWCVVYGSAKSAEYESARFPTWSPDGKLVAYAAKTEGKWYVFIDSKRSEPCDEIACITWADDGRSVWYGCRQGGELWWRKFDAG